VASPEYAKANGAHAAARRFVAMARPADEPIIMLTAAGRRPTQRCLAKAR